MKTSFKIELGIIILLIIVSLTSFYTKVYTYSKILIGLTLIVHSYNNKHYIKRKYMTNVFLIVGIFTILLALLEAFYG